MVYRMSEQMESAVAAEVAESVSVWVRPGEATVAMVRVTARCWMGAAGQEEVRGKKVLRKGQDEVLVEPRRQDEVKADTAER